MVNFEFMIKFLHETLGWAESFGPDWTLGPIQNQPQASATDMQVRMILYVLRREVVRMILVPGISDK